MYSFGIASRMASVQASRRRKYETMGAFEEEPVEHIETEADRQVKQLIEKQLETNISLQDHLQRKKDFVMGNQYIPLSEQMTGQMSMGQCQKLEEYLSRVEYLQSCGLTEAEIQLQLDRDGPQWAEAVYNKYRKIDRAVLEERCRRLDEKIRRKQEDMLQPKPFSGMRPMSRHELELELSLKPSSERTRLLQAIATNQKLIDDPRPLDHPINHLQSIEKELFGHLREEKKGRKRNRKQEKSMIRKVVKTDLSEVGSETESSELILTDYSPSLAHIPRNNSLWDVRSTPELSTSCSSSTSGIDRDLRTSGINQGSCAATVSRTYTCAPQNQYTIQDGNIIPLEKMQNYSFSEFDASTSGKPFVVMGDYLEDIQRRMKFIRDEDVRNNCLTVEEIRKIPRFEAYHPGKTSRVLYLKNLTDSVQEADLISLFGRFEDPEERKIVYRLLVGRMRGQAFVTFPDCETATAALELVNGYNLKGKPVIIEYGKVGD